MGKEMQGKTRLIIAFLVVVLLGAFYYNFGIKYFQSEMENYDTAKIEEEIADEETKALKKKKMQQDLDNAVKESVGEIAVYDAQVEEVVELDRIFANKGTVISISWEEPSLTDDIVRRKATIRFEAGSWNNVQEILDELANCKFRTTLDDLYIRIEGNNDYEFTNTDKIAGTVAMTFFETTDGALTTEGLVNLNTNTQTEEE